MKAQLHAKKSFGFTLAEILIVVGITAVLLLLAIPAAGVLRRTAQTAKCLSNIRQYGVALLSYAAERNGVKIWDVTDSETKSKTKPQFYKWLSEETKYLPTRPRFIARWQMAARTIT